MECEQNKFNVNEIGFIQIVLQDKEGGRIYATIPRSLEKKYISIILEFHIYTMNNFIVVDNMTKKKNSVSRWVLVLSHRTRVEHIENPTFPLEERCRAVNSQKNIIGEVVGKEDPRELVTSKGIETKRLVVIVEDLDLLNGFESTSVRISHQSTQTSWGGTDEVNNGTSVVKTIEEVLKQCPKKVKTPIGNRYEYAKCGHTHGCAALRYKVEVMVFDGTGSITLLLWDRETNQLYGKAAEKIVEEDIYTVMKVCDDKETVVKNKPKQMNISTFVNITVHGFIVNKRMEVATCWRCPDMPWILGRRPEKVRTRIEDSEHLAEELYRKSWAFKMPNEEGKLAFKRFGSTPKTGKIKIVSKPLNRSKTDRSNRTETRPAFSIQSNTPALPTLTPSNSPIAQHTPSLVPPITLKLAVPLNTGELNPSLSFSRRTAPDAVAGWSFEAHSVPHSANVSDSQQWKHSHRACLLPLSRSSVPPSQTLLLHRKLCSCLCRQFCSCLRRQLCSSRLFESLKYKPPTKIIAGSLKCGSIVANQIDEEFQLSTNRFTRKGRKKQKSQTSDTDN
ncbi:hypothetical protein Ahy_B01g056445 [Arachis hypogaea]|uniref:Replication protein A 70 kDa DNA-binding subunit B/D first OB fold domain-containing protein n=1 Tax=Arachis hypogaea TaxID=3818 RepID=A0A445AYV7_ARAHY|nr:hypothetical protein Ahy_B01g056445 [Arachis hypogaea]